MKVLILTLMLALCTISAQGKSGNQFQNRIFSSGTEETLVYSQKLSARCKVLLTGKYDESKKLYTEFTLFVAYSYNPFPGTTRRYDYSEEKVFHTTMPVKGKKKFTLLAIDKGSHSGTINGEPDYDILEKEGKCFAVKVDATLNGKKYDEYNPSKALKVKFKIQPVDRNKKSN